MVRQLTEKAKPRRWNLAQFAAASATLKDPPVVEVAEPGAMTPNKPPVVETDDPADARTAVLQGGYWLTAVQIVQLVKLAASRLPPHPQNWRSQKRIFTIHHGGVEYFPAYGLNPEDGYRPLKLMADLIKVLAEHKDSWQMAQWFQTESDFLYGESPQQILVDEPERVMAAARYEIQQGKAS